MIAHLLQFILPFAFALAPLKFRFEPFGDTGTPLPCTHIPDGTLGIDYLVKCFDSETTKVRRYRVRLFLKEYLRPNLPKQSFELAYWITEENGASTGHTTWFHFNKAGQFQSFSSGISVEKDTAGLYLDFTL